MAKIISIAALVLLCGVPTTFGQPGAPKHNSQRQDAQSKPTATPANGSQYDVNKAAKAESERYRQERDTKEDIFREQQVRQNQIVARAAVINVAVLIAYAIVAFLTLLAISKQAGKAGEQVTKMDATLKEMQQQRKTLHTQAIGTLSQARSIRESLIETRKLVEKNAEVVEIMKRQLATTIAISNAQIDFAVIEGKIAERSAKAAEDSVEVVRQNMIYSQRAYLSIVRGTPLPFEEGFQLGIENSGNTPAKNVHIWYVVDVGFLPPQLPSLDKASCEDIGVLPPRAPYDLGAHVARELTAEETKLLQTPDEEFRLWCTGEICYHDIFQGNSDNFHRTKFCFYQELGNPFLKPWGVGNEAD